MEKFTVYKGLVAPLDRENVDPMPLFQNNF